MLADGAPLNAGHGGAPAPYYLMEDNCPEGFTITLDASLAVDPNEPDEAVDFVIVSLPTKGQLYWVFGGEQVTGFVR